MFKPFSRPLVGGVIALLGSLLLVFTSPPAQAGVLSNLFGTSESIEKGKAQPGRRQWDLQEFTSIKLVPREPGSPANEQPIDIQQEALRQQLAQVRLGGSSSGQPLFASTELAELLEPLSEAFASAGPDDDILLLSTARRGGILSPQTAITARLFFQGGRLQMIVRDARYSFIDDLRGGHIEPTFVYGSRAKGSAAVIRSASAESKRPDWLALATPQAGAAAAPQSPAQPAAAAPATMQPAPAPMAAPAGQAAPAAPAIAAPVAPSGQPALRPRDPGFGEEIEQRLTTIKRLRDRGLITEEEYQQKRREIMQLL